MRGQKRGFFVAMGLTSVLGTEELPQYKIMKTIKTTFWMMVLMGGICSSAVADNLGDMLREAGWGKMIGTWVDADTKGENIQVRYAWKYKNHAIQVTSKMGELQSTSLIGLNAKTGEVFLTGVNNRGGASIGKWVEQDGDAVLEAAFVSESGEEGSMQFRHHLKDDDTMIVTVPRENGDEMKITLVRKKATPKKKSKEKK